MKRKVLVSVVTLTTLSVSGLFAVDTTACIACHGKNFEKKALNVSKVVKEMSKEEIVAALKAYKAGTGGHTPMKATMQAQAKNLSDTDIEAIAEAIAGKSADSAKTTADKTAKKTEDSATKAVDTAKEKATQTIKEKAVDAAKDKVTDAAKTQALDAAKAAAKDSVADAAKGMLK